MRNQRAVVLCFLVAALFLALLLVIEVIEPDDHIQAIGAIFALLVGVELADRT